MFGSFKRIKYLLKHKHKVLSIISIDNIRRLKTLRGLKKLRKRYKHELKLWLYQANVKTVKEFYNNEEEIRAKSYHLFTDIDHYIHSLEMLDITIRKYKNKKD